MNLCYRTGFRWRLSRKFKIMDKEIEVWRLKIDEIDEKLVELFNRRAEYAGEIGNIKKKLGLPVYNPVSYTHLTLPTN